MQHPHRDHRASRGDLSARRRVGGENGAVGAIAADGSRAADYVSDYAGQKSIELKANFTVVEQKPSDPGQPDDTTPDDNKEKGDSVNTGDSAGSLIAFSALAISGLAALSLKKRKH